MSDALYSAPEIRKISNITEYSLCSGAICSVLTKIITTNVANVVRTELYVSMFLVDYPSSILCSAVLTLEDWHLLKIQMFASLC